MPFLKRAMVPLLKVQLPAYLPLLIIFDFL
jgi:hypothetical protein